MIDIKCKYEVCTCAVPHELCPHPLGLAREDEVEALAERFRVAVTTPNTAGNATHYVAMAREALHWRDETRPQQPAALAVPEDAIEAAYWDFDARHKGYWPHKTAPQSERDAFKWAVRAMLAAAADRKGE